MYLELINFAALPVNFCFKDDKQHTLCCCHPEQLANPAGENSLRFTELQVFSHAMDFILISSGDTTFKPSRA